MGFLDSGLSRVKTGRLWGWSRFTLSPVPSALPLFMSPSDYSIFRSTTSLLRRFSTRVQVAS